MAVLDIERTVRGVAGRWHRHTPCAVASKVAVLLLFVYPSVSPGHNFRRVQQFHVCPPPDCWGAVLEMYQPDYREPKELQPVLIFHSG